MKWKVQEAKGLWDLKYMHQDDVKKLSLEIEAKVDAS